MLSVLTCFALTAAKEAIYARLVREEKERKQREEEDLENWELLMEVCRWYGDDYVDFASFNALFKLFYAYFRRRTLDVWQTQKQRKRKRNEKCCWRYNNF
jgi:hypothetical protein